MLIKSQNLLYITFPTPFRPVSLRSGICISCIHIFPEVTGGDGGKTRLSPAPHHASSPVPSFTGSATFHRTGMAGPEHQRERIPVVVTHYPRGVIPPITSPGPLRVMPEPITPSPHVVVPASSGSRNSRPADAERERQNRFDQLVGILDRTILDLQNGEEKREENYRANEEERERVFIENEHRRDIEVEQRHEAMLKELEDRSAAFKSPPAAAIPAGSESSARVPLGGGSLESTIPGAFELSSGPPNTMAPAVPPAGDATSIRETASRRAVDVREAIRLEREAALAERERAQGLERAARDQMREEHEAHIHALERELGAVRKELADEKVARAAEEAARHERKRAEMLVQNNMMRNQLGDVIGLLLERQDLKGIRGDDNRKQGGPIGLRFGHVCLCVCVCCVFLVAVGS